ncbi:MAG: TRAP transporter small permease subunit [Desulfobacterales bacterium]|nr:TRAP transporter small permease subunit [Desulfobacterales bacterium]MBF0396040.1 TRAP transporter small permease subunit [Desulfobacterales bacterium]
MRRIEEILITFFSFLMIFLVLFQIVLRDIFHSGIMGGDALVRHLILWVAFLGACRATSDKTHIRIDIASRIIPQNKQYILNIAVDVFSILICAILFYSSIKFVSSEYSAAAKLSFLNIPIWIVQIIIPLGYFIIILRFIQNILGNKK